MFDCYRSDFNDQTILITIMLTNFCNYKCEYCIEKYNNMKSNVNIKFVIKLIQHIHDINPTKIINLELYGGEPTLHPNIISFCKLIRKQFQYIHSIDIYSNFTASLKIYQQLIDLHCFLSLSYHYSQSKDTQFLKKILLLKQRCYSNIALNIMYEHQASDKVLKIYKFLLKQNIKTELGLIISTPYFMSNYSNEQYLKFNILNTLYNEKIYYYVQNEKYIVYAHNKLNFRNCLCSAGKNSIYISADNKLYPCNMYFRNRHKLNYDGKYIGDKNTLDTISFNYTFCNNEFCLPCLPVKIKTNTCIFKNFLIET